ncbi:MAG: TatD family hydrolase [Desulfobacterota bacterium]|nr:TatD family hydrolase [Thermodesulfobacteriota bacterium]MDW8002693.1 TatD family hydrolase [Deltaproteobacteria bacterium]
MVLVDSHCHLELEEFDRDRDEILLESKREGLAYILICGTEKRYFDKVLEITNKYDFVFGALGIHPHSSIEWKNVSPAHLKKLFAHEKIVAYGEIGLDFYKNYSPPDIQRDAFASQLKFAKENGLPIIVHSRSAETETIEFLDLYYGEGQKGVIHCFSYDKDAAKKFLDRGFFISIPGTVTYKNSTKIVEVVKYLPIDSLLVETDAPFLAPYPKVGERNLPYYVKYTFQRIAEIKGIGVDLLGESVVNNFKRLFLGGINEASSNSRGHDSGKSYR